MTSMYDPASPSLLAGMASVIVERHQDGGTCQQCTADGCTQRAWAEPILTQWRAERRAWIAEHDRRSGR
ncbi:hypothetical protein [Micromonospora sp. WMMD1082]|uniref:hypothetical protein n=1 Tax=Micromonospora sp. WMMD1082 TaxID=3016104 RepID=UPI002415CFCD|nr:hypothetical protein [Micromonospora sp. WMMD1082]MDG4794911.1 hypothetical protein [Micromonospora sp. WMMD1082]